VYPRGRIVEFFDESPRNVLLTDLILWAGFNNGPEDVLYLAGLSNDLLLNLQGASLPSKLEGLLVANGYVLARNGWQNQKRDAIGLSRAQEILVKSRQIEGPHPQSPFSSSIGRSLLAELTKVKRQEASDRLSQAFAERADLNVLNSAHPNVAPATVPP
jgi:hypothetical protein